MRAAISIVIIIVLATAAAPAWPSGTPRELCDRYLSALTDGRYADAENCWAASTISASKRLGIEYDDIPAKYDCASPIMTLLPDIHAGSVKVSIDTVISRDAYAEIHISLRSASDSAQYRYVAIQSGNEWLLTSPLQAMTSGWNVRETKYTELFYDDSAMVNDYACAKLDRFVEETGRYLGLTDDDLDLLERNKIYYYLCDKGQIEDISGYVTQGMADLPLDAIITAFLPHRHELTHLLVNFAERHIPLYTEPFLQEGTAAYFGGRWGRSSQAILYSGAAIIRNNITDIKDVLTYDDFHGVIGTPDISYPLSAILVGRLLERMGSTRFLVLYRALSGSRTYLRSLMREDIMALVDKYCGATWGALEDDCRRWADSMKTCGISPSTKTPAGPPLAVTANDDSTILAHVWADDKMYQVEISVADSVGSGLLIISDGTNASSVYKSRLFEQHAPGQAYHGESFGIKFTEQEVGCYDFLCDELTGIYVPGFAGTLESPAPSLWDASTRTYRFAVDKKLFPSLDTSTWRLRLIAI